MKKECIKEKHWHGKIVLQNNGSFKLYGGFNIMIVLKLPQSFTVWLCCKLQESRDCVQAVPGI